MLGILFQTILHRFERDRWLRRGIKRRAWRVVVSRLFHHRSLLFREPKYRRETRQNAIKRGRQSPPLRATLSHGYSPLLRLDWGLLIRFSVDIEVYCSDLELTPVVTPFRSLYRIRISRCFRPVFEPTVDASFQISFRVSVSKETSHCAWSRNLNRKEEEKAGL